MKISNLACGKPLRVYKLQPSSLQPIFKLGIMSWTHNEGMKISNLACGKPLRVYKLQSSNLQPIFKLDRKGQGFISLALNW